ncbi:MAG: hypothetical protein GTO51_02710 [Candidatus Latescibacteria bacterium]|nr:hypothetical protein [Candidatus Latescibacterota bacterium]NIM22594.1 hypothetical protein [Candidatus Latescibacterota bacterium]NIM64883.1 hypothetical protein [Candidatus Latescibacterota bacterium]NIO01398.1 hypothetical protein [Candidatus Latescibacterota bacterium]NIO27908.1 hypothetical protein [Candidatus Latescibacterota bacterium]
MTIDVENTKTDVLLSLLGEARAEADSLRQRLEKYKRTLLATRLIMGHELKRPTTAISGYLDLALEDLEMWAGCDAVENIKKARGDCELLNELNEFFLELLRIDNEDEDLNIRKIDIQGFVDGVVDDFPVKLHARSRVKVSVSDNAKHIEFNPNALKLILVNVVENALIYSPQNSEVKVSVKRSPDKRGTTPREIFKIQIVDTGVGIPEEYLQKIFNPFVRVPSEKVSGSGLGLTLVRSLIELYGGDVSIKSKTNQGTTVYITVPTLQKQKSDS